MHWLIGPWEMWLQSSITRFRTSIVSLGHNDLTLLLSLNPSCFFTLNTVTWYQMYHIYKIILLKTTCTFGIGKHLISYQNSIASSNRLIVPPVEFMCVFDMIKCRYHVEDRLLMSCREEFWNRIWKWIQTMSKSMNHWTTVKPVCNDHLSNKIYYLWFIQ